MILDLAERRRGRQLDRLAVLARAARPDDPGSWADDLLMGAEDVAHTHKHRAVRLPEELMQRAEALLPRVQATAGPLAAAVRLSTAAVVRLALERGLDSLEADLDAGEEPAAKRGPR